MLLYNDAHRLIACSQTFRSLLDTHVGEGTTPLPLIGLADDARFEEGYKITFPDRDGTHRCIVTLDDPQPWTGLDPSQVWILYRAAIESVELPPSEAAAEETAAIGSGKEPYDPEVAARAMGVSIELINTLIGDFVEQFYATYPRLKEAVAYRKASLHNDIHKIKGAASSLRLPVAAILADIETEPDENRQQTLLEAAASEIADLAAQYGISTASPQPDETSSDAPITPLEYSIAKTGQIIGLSDQQLRSYLGTLAGGIDRIVTLYSDGDIDKAGEILSQTRRVADILLLPRISETIGGLIDPAVDRGQQLARLHAYNKELKTMLV